jgi:hypothetical protein
MEHERCEQCGFDGAAYSDAALLEAIRALGPRWRALLADAGTDAWTRGITVGTERIETRRLLEHALHDSTHHLLDVENGFERLR